MDELQVRSSPESGRRADEGTFLITTENGTRHILNLGDRVHAEFWVRFGAPGREYSSDGQARGCHVVPDTIRVGDTIDYTTQYNRGIRDYDRYRTSHVVSIERVQLYWKPVD